MSTNKTTNYNLHAWVPDDDFLRSEFNENFSAIDARLKSLSDVDAQKAEIVVGTYTGDGASSQTISLGFTPRAVFVCESAGYVTMSYSFHGGLALQGAPIAYGSYPVLECVSGGFRVHYQSISGNYTTIISTNASGSTYHYLALK